MKDTDFLAAILAAPDDGAPRLVRILCLVVDSETETAATPQARTVLYPANPEFVTGASYVAPSRMALDFADGFSGEWSFDELELDMSGMKLETIEASADGAAVLVRSKWNDNVVLDSSALRAAIDPAYAGELNKRISAILAEPRTVTMA